MYQHFPGLGHSSAHSLWGAKSSRGGGWIKKHTLEFTLIIKALWALKLQRDAHWEIHKWCLDLPSCQVWFLLLTVSLQAESPVRCSEQGAVSACACCLRTSEPGWIQPSCLSFLGLSSLLNFGTCSHHSTEVSPHPPSLHYCSAGLFSLSFFHTKSSLDSFFINDKIKKEIKMM